MLNFKRLLKAVLWDSLFCYMSAATAVKAQGTTLTVGATGSPATITGITKALPAVFTATAHGFSNGDVVLLASIGGMVQFNGQAGVVYNVTTNTFALAGIDSSNYTTYTSGGTATPTAEAVGDITKFNGFDGKVSEIDTTDFSSTAKEFMGGLRDFGQISFDLQVVDSDVGQSVMRSSNASSTPSLFTLTYPNGKGRTFKGFVITVPESGGTDTVITGTWSVRISGSMARF